MLYWTNVTTLTILNKLSKWHNKETGEFELNSFKIIYITPMKALVQEMVHNFSTWPEAFGTKVSEPTGDTQMTKE